MESQLQHTDGRHYDEHDNLPGAGHLTGHDYNEDEHHGEKKSMIKKVKEKAKKLKNTITKHGHSQDHHHHDEEEDEDDDDDDETVENPEVHGAPMYDSARVAPGGPDAILAQPRGNLDRPSVMAEDRYPKPVGSHTNIAAPKVSTGACVSEPSGGLGHTEVYSHEEKGRGKIGQPTTGMEEDPFAPHPTRVVSPIGATDPTYGARHVAGPDGHHGLAKDVNRGGLKTTSGKSTGMEPDPHATRHPSAVGSNPSDYETKVTNPTHTGGKEIDLSQLEHSTDKMSIGSGPKSFDPNHPENLPLAGNAASRGSSYADRISSSASPIADKAAVAKDVIASKLGYSSQNPTTESHHETVQKSGTATDYAHKITDKVTGTLAPVYEKVVDTGSSMISKLHGTVTGGASGTEQPQLHGGAEASTEGTDGGVSVKEYLAGTLTPGDDDKALKEVITHAFHRGNREESEKKSTEDRPMGIVTESVEVRQRLGTDRRGGDEHSGNVTTDKGVTERLSEAMGSWFGGKGDAPKGTLGTSYVTDEGLSSNPTGDQSKVGGKYE